MIELDHHRTLLQALALKLLEAENGPYGAYSATSSTTGEWMQSAPGCPRKLRQIPQHGTIFDRDGRSIRVNAMRLVMRAQAFLKIHAAMQPLDPSHAHLLAVLEATVKTGSTASLAGRGQAPMPLPAAIEAPVAAEQQAGPSGSGAMRAHASEAAAAPMHAPSASIQQPHASHAAGGAAPMESEQVGHAVAGPDIALGGEAGADAAEPQPPPAPASHQPDPDAQSLVDLLPEE